MDNTFTVTHHTQPKDQNKTITNQKGIIQPEILENREAIRSVSEWKEETSTEVTPEKKISPLFIFFLSKSFV